jgi:hypothetical protein
MYHGSIDNSSRAERTYSRSERWNERWDVVVEADVRR